MPLTKPAAIEKRLLSEKKTAPRKAPPQYPHATLRPSAR